MKSSITGGEFDRLVKLIAKAAELQKQMEALADEARTITGEEGERFATDTDSAIFESDLRDGMKLVRTLKIAVLRAKTRRESTHV